MAIKERTCRWGFQLLLLGVITLAQRCLSQGCVCPRATIVTGLPAEIPREACCLNYSGSTLGRVMWPAFGNNNNESHRPLEILDLSHCNITHIELSTEGATTQLKEVHLHHNALETLPQDFLAQQPSLQVLDLGWNRLEVLPKGLLRGSEVLRHLNLRGNRLRSLPLQSASMPRLKSLELDGNPWDCSCSLVELMVGTTATGDNGTVGGGAGGSSSLLDPAGNLTCASPRWLAGTAIRSVRAANVCQPAGLTTPFILLPLLILAGLVLCWCCGRKRKGRKDATFGTKTRKNKKSHSQKAQAAAGHLHHQPHDDKHRPGANGDASREAGSMERGGGILKNQLLLRPASALLSSTRDIYQEVEVEAKMGSHASISSTEDGQSHSGGLPGSVDQIGGVDGEGDGDEGGNSGQRAELDDVVSVSEVLKDSANREKAYLAQSTEYYSLVPGMDLGDSDHGEYESIDLA